MPSYLDWYTHRGWRYSGRNAEKVSVSAGICQHSGWKNARVGDRQASLRDRVEKFIGEHLEGFGDRPPLRLRARRNGQPCTVFAGTTAQFIVANYTVRILRDTVGGHPKQQEQPL